MKKILLFAILGLICTSMLSADKLIYSNYKDLNELKSYIADKEISVNYYNDDFFIATASDSRADEFKVIDNNRIGEYFLAWFSKGDNAKYEKDLSSISNILFKNNQYAIIKTNSKNIKNLYPAAHSGIVKIQNYEVKLPKSNFLKKISVKNANPEIEQMVAAVDTNIIKSHIQTLQDYGTRNCYTEESVQAQNWIKEQYESYGLETELQDFPMSSGEASDNVIAYLPGNAFPDEYVIIGGHYDSISGWNNENPAPGADDNASGSCGVMEAARILSQYNFSRSIIFCAFSGEEYGLYGSSAFASRAESEGMNIVGYFNLDMIGYRNPGDNLHTDVIAPSSAQDLVDFYTEVANIYVPELAIEAGALSGGDSDHTSFNNHGYMGIFPFEDSQNYSPYIHSAEDLIGPSVNSFELVEALTKASLASVATMAELFNGFFPPRNLEIITNEENEVTLSWEMPLDPAKDFSHFKVFRNDILLSTTTNTTFLDDTIEFSNEYNYYITASYDGEDAGESCPSNTVTVTIGLKDLFYYDFEENIDDWTIAGTETGWQWNYIIGDFLGNTTKYIAIDSDEFGNGTLVADYAISPVMNLSSCFNVKLTFDYAYRSLSSDIFKVLYKTSSNGLWTDLASLASTETFIEKTISLPEDAYSENLQIAFYYDDNNSWAWYAAFDNVKLSGFEEENAIGTNPIKASLSNSPNPFNPNTTIFYSISESSDVKLTIYNVLGQKINTLVNEKKSIGEYKMLWNGKDFSGKSVASGIYFYSLQVNGKNLKTEKMLLVK